jgi:hemoglobin
MIGDVPEGIDEAALTNVVHTFYGKVRDDPELGPVFDYAISDWPHHLGKMVDFWSSVMLTTGRYKGNPVMMHIKHKPRINPPLFDRWLELWRETTEELVPPEAAAALQAKAARIAESLQLAMFFRLDPPPSRPALNADLPAGA